MTPSIKILLIALLVSATHISCNQKTKEKKEPTDTARGIYTKGTFGFDLEFLKKYKEVIVLKSKDGRAQLIVCPEYQGRVMTSTAQGPDGYSFGWLNHDLIASGEVRKNFNPVGGEERFWLGPEGSQFSIFFKPQSGFDFANWYVPKEIDLEPFTTISVNSKEAVFQKEITLTNYSNTEFSLRVKRKVRLLEKEEISNNLNIHIPADMSQVGFESENIITNQRENAWVKESGMLSIWILNMLNSSPGTTVIIPFKKGDESESGKIVTDEYFGKVPSDRLAVKDSVLFFKADGKKRSKIGISPKRALPVAGSYDALNEILTIIQFTIPENTNGYVNSLFGIQDHPFEGDVVNAYNDGPLEDGEQFGPFYELESSSPAAALLTGESMSHVHRTYHFKGKREELNSLALALLGVDFATISTVWK